MIKQNNNQNYHEHYICGEVKKHTPDRNKDRIVLYALRRTEARKHEISSHHIARLDRKRESRQGHEQYIKECKKKALKKGEGDVLRY